MKDRRKEFLESLDFGTLSTDDRKALAQLLDCLETHYPEFIVLHGDDFALYSSGESDHHDGQNA